MSAAPQIAGFNTRFDKWRFRGASGDHGANAFAFQHEVEIVAADPAGIYDSAETVLALSNTFQTVIEVTEVFDGGATIIVGRPGAPNVLVNLGDAVDLTTLGKKYVPREVIQPSDSVLRVTIGGAPTQGQATVSVQLQT